LAKVEFKQFINKKTMERKIIERNVITQALRKITYGFYILTSKHEDKLAAGTVCWVSQVAFEPPLVMTAVKVNSHLRNVIKDSGVFAINVVGKAEKPMLWAFFKATKHDEENRLNGYKYEEGVLGCPIITRLPAFFECKVTEVIEPGDHTIFIGEVVNPGVTNVYAEPLIEWETDLRYGG
jgi:flavin reductase (DIM6/NTAB) family NADH-FMN oxidoreductase RutF